MCLLCQGCLVSSKLMFEHHSRDCQRQLQGSPKETLLCIVLFAVFFKYVLLFRFVLMFLKSACYLCHVCLSIHLSGCPHVSALLPLHGVVWNLLLETFIRVRWQNPDLIKTGHKCQACYVKTWTCLYCWQQCEIFCSSTTVWRNHCCISIATLNSSVLLTLECVSALKGNALLCFHGNNFSILILLTVTCCWTIPNALMHLHDISGYTCYLYVVYLVFVCFRFILSQPTLKLCFIGHHSLYFEIGVLVPS